jgi:hypothetical protein
MAEAVWAASVGSVRNLPSISTAGTVASLRTAKQARFTPRSKEESRCRSKLSSDPSHHIERKILVIAEG